MLSQLDQGWLLIAIATIAILSFLLGLLSDVLMREDAFGPIGNGIIIGLGFFLGVVLPQHLGFTIDGIGMAMTAGLAGSIAVLAVLTLIKASFER
jgi:hypothetical protein